MSARLFVIAAALLFATGGPAVKASSLGSLELSGLRCAVAALVLLVCMPAWRPPWRRPDDPARFDARVVWVGCAYAATLILFIAATQRTTAANAIFLQSTSPLYLLVLGPFVLGERLGRAELGYAVALLVGLTCFFVGREPALASAPDPWLGNWLGAGAGLCWALTLLGLRLTGRAGGQGPAIIAGNLVCVVACAPWLWPFPSLNAIDVAIVLYLGAIQIALAYVWLARGVAGVSALEASLLLLVEPVANAALTAFTHDEIPSALAATGGLVIVVATAWHTLRGSRQLPVET